MRKFTLILSLLVMLLTTAMAQVTDLRQLSNEKKYFIESARCFLMYSDVESVSGGLCTNSGTAVGDVTKDKTNPAQQFKIEKDGDNYYLFSVGANKYVSADGSYSEEKTATLTFTNVGGDYPWKMLIGSNGMNSQNPGLTNNGILLNGWTTTDAGNCYKILDVEEEVLRTFVTSLEELNNTTAYTVTAGGARGSWYSDGTQINGTYEKGAAYDLNDNKLHFAFLKSEKNNYYLYSVADEKFVSKSGGYTTYTEQPVQTIQFLNGTRGSDYPWVIAFADGSQIGLSTGYSPDVITHYNDLADEGNCVRLEVAGTIDVTGALAIIADYENIGVYKNELSSLVSQVEGYVNNVGTNVGCYSSSNADYVNTWESIKTFNEQIDNKNVEEIKSQIEVVKEFISSFSINLPVAGKYYFIKNNNTVWTAAEYGLYANNDAPGWKAFAGDSDLSFWWTAENTEDGGVVFKSVSTGKYLQGSSSQSGVWSLNENVASITFATCGFTTDGTALMNLTLSGWNMHANGHNGGSGTSGNIVSWNGDATSASAWMIIEADEDKLKDIYKLTVAAALSELEALKQNYTFGDGLGEYSCNEELMTQIESFNIDEATYEQLLAIMQTINEFKASVAINMPNTVAYYRFKAGNGDTYMLSDIYESNNKYLAMGAGTDAASIFYLGADNSLLSYKNGCYLSDAARSASSWTCLAIGQTGAAAHFAAGSVVGVYGFYIGDDASRAYYSGRGNYVDAGGSIASGTGYDWAIEAVTSLPVTITVAGYASFYAPVAVKVAEGVEAYYAVSVGDAWVKLAKIEDGIVPANTGVILKGAAADYEFEITTTDATIEDNLLEGTAAATIVNKDNGAYYVLGNGSNGVGLYAPVNGENDTQFINNSHKAYLHIAGAAQGTGYRFDFDGTTGISEVETEAGNAVIYDLTGRRVEKAINGIYIVNGKKVIVK